MIMTLRCVLIWVAAAAVLSGETSIPPSTTEGAYGSVTTDAKSYKPLDTVILSIEGRAAGDSRAEIRVEDSNRREYFRGEAVLKNNRGELRFQAAGALGAQYVYLWWPGEKRYSRYVNFQLDAETGIQSNDPDFDGLYTITKDAMRLGRRDYTTPRGRFVGYISADTWHFDGIWLRDWIYQIPAYKYWEREMRCGLDRFLERQAENGQVPDGIERDGRTWRVGLESDVEYIMTLGVWETWKATGDDEWLRVVMPKLERALAYIRSDPKHWDARHQLVKRQHSCDTWDYDIDGAKDLGTSRHVVATCDQSGYYLAFRAMGEMYRHLGDAEAAGRWTNEAEGYRRRASSLLWAGTKFLHHFHLEPIDHGDFDERTQLAMGNTWAMTRGLATPDQAGRIIDEYKRRQEQTGDAHPWWSLQPGYPDHLGYWKDAVRKQGAYANGGLMPWVGGELCRAAFLFGREKYGVELLRQYATHLRRTGGSHVWYYPNGEAGFRTTNEVNYAGWGMAQWVDALVEGLSGIRDELGQMRQVSVAPRWPVAGVKAAVATVRYAPSDAYFTYRARYEAGRIGIEFAGSGERAEFRVLAPGGFKARGVTVNGKPVAFRTEGSYVVFTSAIGGVGQVMVE